MLKVSPTRPKSNSFKLSKSEKLWLQEIVDAYFKREKIDLITLRVRLSDKLGDDFDHSKIDYKLIRNDTLPTLYSIGFIDPTNPILILADKVLKHIIELVKKDPSLRRFGSAELSAKLNYQGKDMDLCLELIYSVGLFFNSASGTSGKTFGYDFVEVDSVDYIKNILAYKDLKSILEMKPLTQSEAKLENFTKNVHPLVKNSDIIPNTAFIIMRMDKDYKEGPEICKTIKEVCKSFGIKAVRADDVEHSDKITDLILERIRTSEFLIADLSGEKPNIYYEVGYAHANSRSPHLYRRLGTKLHFDLSVHNVPEYETIDDLRRQLTNRFSALRPGKTISKIKKI
jgi:hypothetical protein